MSDAEMAKSRLLRNGSSLVIVRNGTIIFETGQSGVSGFLSAIEELGKERLNGAAVADRIVGRAAALLCVYGGVKSAYAVVLSKEGKKVLEKNAVVLEFETLVPTILNRQKTDACPFEKLVSGVSDAAEAYEKLKSCMPAKNRIRGEHRV